MVRSIGRDVALLPAMVFGGLIGALIVSLVRTPHLPVNGMVAATTAILVGWWIQIALKRRGELDRVPIDYLATLNRRIDDLVVRCLDNAISSNREELLEKHLTPLANEVYWLREFANRVDRDNVRRLTTKLADHYLDMKEHLTAHRGDRSAIRLSMQVTKYV